MKKATKDKISKFLFYSLTEEQAKGLDNLLNKDVDINPPLVIRKGIGHGIKVEIELIPGSYGNKEKVCFAINQIPINNCDGSANKDAIKAVRYLQEVSESLLVDDTLITPLQRHVVVARERAKKQIQAEKSNFDWASGASFNWDQPL